MFPSPDGHQAAGTGWWIGTISAGLIEKKLGSFSNVSLPFLGE